MLHLPVIFFFPSASPQLIIHKKNWINIRLDCLPPKKRKFLLAKWKFTRGAGEAIGVGVGKESCMFGEICVHWDSWECRVSLFGSFYN